MVADWSQRALHGEVELHEVVLRIKVRATTANMAAVRSTGLRLRRLSSSLGESSF